ncbi:MAG: hypothetical protein ACPW60_10170 [Methylohalobius sp. ZOD2]
MKKYLLMAMFPGVGLAAPGVTVLSPESGESFFAGDTVYVQWEGNEVESCQVEFPDGVEENLSSSGVFITPPLSQSGSGAVTVTCQTADGQSVSDSASFTVQPAPPAPDPIADITLLPEIGLFDEYNPGETVQVSWEVDTTRASVDTCIGVIDNSPFTNIVPLYPDLGEEDETFEIGSVSGSINLEADHDRRIEISCINNEVDFRASSSDVIDVDTSITRLGSDNTIVIGSIDVAGVSYWVRLVPFENPNDPEGLYWKLGDHGTGKGAPLPGNDYSPVTGDVTLSRVETEAFEGAYRAELVHWVNPQDPLGLYWSLGEVEKVE